MKKQYPCPLAKNKVCEFGGSKRFNWGFAYGVKSYCRHPKEKRFITFMVSCPLEAHLTKHAPDVVESAASSEISSTSEVSASEAESNPATTQVM